jgi:anti-anti-sigma factor
VQAHNVEIQTHSPTTRVVRLYGDHDLSSSEALSLALMETPGYTHVVVDLSRCTFIDSTLIRVLLAASRRAQGHNGSVELVVPAEANAVRRTLELANVQRVLPFHASCATALQSIAEAERLGWAA